MTQVGNSKMPDKVKELRDIAAQEFASARRADTDVDKAIHKTRAQAIKSLAETQAWLEGRPDRAPPKRQSKSD